MFKYKYQLRAVSVHIGQAHSGHFITYRRGIGVQNRSSWYKTSDMEVNVVEKARNMQKTMSHYAKIINGKILFYLYSSLLDDLI